MLEWALGGKNKREGKENGHIRKDSWYSVESLGGFHMIAFNFSFFCKWYGVVREESVVTWHFKECGKVWYSCCKDNNSRHTVKE